MVVLLNGAHITTFSPQEELRWGDIPIKLPANHVQQMNTLTFRYTYKDASDMPDRQNIPHPLVAFKSMHIMKVAVEIEPLWTESP